MKSFLLLTIFLVLLISLDQAVRGFTIKFNFNQDPEVDRSRSSSRNGQALVESTRPFNHDGSRGLAATSWGNSLAASYVKDKYIIVLNENASVDRALSALRNLISRVARFSNSLVEGVLHNFDIGLGHRGFIAHLDETMARMISELSDIAYVEKDKVVHAYDTESGAPWGLARISHRSNPHGIEEHKYYFDSNAGRDVVAYVIDTGVQISHSEFEGRAAWGATIPKDDIDADGNGHGTHVSGTIAGKTYGVAKNATIVAVKVLRTDGSGSLSDVILGIQWAVDHHKERVKSQKKKVKSVANMSLGGGKSKALDKAVDAAVQAGIHFAVAAGNDDDDACYYSPAASSYAVTVGATTSSDSRAWFSNWGSCVDVLAPGQDILSSWIGNSNTTNTISGTSMASPHVAGLLALWISEPRFENLSTDELKKKVIAVASKGLLSNLPSVLNTKNRLLYSDPPSTDV